MIMCNDNLMIIFCVKNYQLIKLSSNFFQRLSFDNSITVIFWKKFHEIIIIMIILIIKCTQKISLITLSKSKLTSLKSTVNTSSTVMLT